MNLTITVEDDVLLLARKRALEENTSVNAVLRSHLEDYAGVRKRQSDALDELFDLARTTSSARGDASWSREELHER